MTEVHRVSDEGGATALADLLNGHGRRRPVVVITVAVGRADPYIDADEVLDEVGDFAEVYVVATGPHTWMLSSRLPELTQVYGGAGRVYPLGHEWVGDPRKSPLRFAYHEQEGRRSTRLIIGDALRMAQEAGLLGRVPSVTRKRVQGEVAGIPMPERALVRVDGFPATIVQELTLPDVPLDRLLAIGQRVEGWYDSGTRRLDIRESLLPVERALARYQVGDVALARVTDTRADRALLSLHPDLALEVPRDRVTANDLDDLRSLMTVGEVVPVRVAARGPHWSLTLLDIDDDEEPVPAAALLPDGPPWLLPPAMGTVSDIWAEPETMQPEAALPLAPTPPPAAAQPVEPAAAEVTPADSPADAGPPTPAVMARPRQRRQRPAPAGNGPAVQTMTLTIQTLQSDLAGVSTQLTALKDELVASNAEREALVRLREDQDRELRRLGDAVGALRTQLRKEKQRKQRTTSVEEPPRFADPEQQFRYDVLTAWARRTPLAEQQTRSLPDYDLGPDFLQSLVEAPGVAPSKVAHVAFEILTGRAHELPGRDLHQLRESEAGNAAYVRRPSDGATCWRAALQVNTPQARRIHYWQLPGGRIELSRVVLHDDFRP